MKIRHILFSMPILMAACSSGFVIPDPDPNWKPSGGTQGPWRIAAIWLE